jgi:hypothetical protein
MDYAIILTIGAREAVLEMELDERQSFVAALKSELITPDGSPCSDADVSTHPDIAYSSCRLSTGHVPIFRLMSEIELKGLARERGQEPFPRGVVIFDIISSGSSFPGGVVVPR